VPRKGAALVLAAAAVAGCGSTTPASAPPGARRTSLAEGPEGFREARATLSRLAALRSARDAAGARALGDQVLAAGQSLVEMERPEDLRREDVARYGEARARFIDALNAWDRAVAGKDDEALWSAADRVETGYWAWYDAWRGAPAEGAV
jgi:hypothetical protein